MSACGLAALLLSSFAEASLPLSPGSTQPAPLRPTPSGPGPTGPTWLRPIDPPSDPTHRVIFASMLGLTSGLSVVPSLDLALFVGRPLRARRWALGYQLTLSSGLAERYWSGLLTHRHHLAGQRHFGRYGWASVSGGLALLIIRPVLEVEGRLAVRFGPKRRGLFGGLMRLGWNVAYGEHAPMPQLGLFLGISTL